jgi:hypothetical protein
LTTPFSPIDPLLLCSRGLSIDQKMRSKANLRSLVFHHWILYRSLGLAMAKGPKSNVKPITGTEAARDGMASTSQFFIDAESGKACNLHGALETFDPTPLIPFPQRHGFYRAARNGWQ